MKLNEMESKVLCTLVQNRKVREVMYRRAAVLQAVINNPGLRACELFENAKPRAKSMWCVFPGDTHRMWLGQVRAALTSLAGAGLIERRIVGKETIGIGGNYYNGNKPTKYIEVDIVRWYPIEGV